jgi:hypothetical protein
VSEVTPVAESYVRPVAVFEKRPRRYEGVIAVVEAYAAFQVDEAELSRLARVYALDHSVEEAVTKEDVSFQVEEAELSRLMRVPLLLHSVVEAVSGML